MTEIIEVRWSQRVDYETRVSVERARELLAYGLDPMQDSGDADTLRQITTASPRDLVHLDWSNVASWLPERADQDAVSSDGVVIYGVNLVKVRPRPPFIPPTTTKACTTMFKITNLTPLNVKALRELLTAEEHLRVEVRPSVTTFHMEPQEAQRLLATVQNRAADRHGVHGHPYQSLFAVIRKVDAVAASAVGDGGPFDTERGKHEIGEG